MCFVHWQLALSFDADESCRHFIFDIWKTGFSGIHNEWTPVQTNLLSKVASAWHMKHQHDTNANPWQH